MSETLGHYKILDRIGAGRRGEVFRARDTRLGRTTAIRVPSPDLQADPARRSKLAREGRAAAALSHPGIATLFEVGEDQGRLFLAFEYVPGESLRLLIGRGAMNVRRALALAVEIADALAQGHAQGIVHGDLHPGNVVVTPKGRVKVLDFGLWGAHEGPGDDPVGRPKRSSVQPDQAADAPADLQADLYALGAMLYEMVTGRAPRPATGTQGARSAQSPEFFVPPEPLLEAPGARHIGVSQDDTPPASTVNNQVPPELDAILGRALAVRPRDRYQRAAELAAALRAVASRLELDASSRLLPDLRAARAGRSTRKGWLAGAAIVALLAAGVSTSWPAVAGLWHRWFGPPPSPRVIIVPFRTAADQAYVAVGVAHDLATSLGRVPGVQVVGRFDRRQSSSGQPSQEMNAGTRLTGSVERQGDELRLVVELVDLNSGVPLWTGDFARPIAEILAVQTEIAEQIGRALRVPLGPSAARARTAARRVDGHAYDVYLRGRARAAAGEHQQATGLYERAIGLDPALAEAYAGLAEALASVPGAIDDPETRGRYRWAIESAAQLDPDRPGLEELRAKLVSNKGR